MKKLPNFIDMAKTPAELKEDVLESVTGSFPQNLYPWGLSISLENEQLDKLGLDCDCEPGDAVYMHVLAKVTSVSKRETTEGGQKRIELQITGMAVDDVEEEAEEQPVQRKKIGPQSLYK